LQDNLKLLANFIYRKPSEEVVELAEFISSKHQFQYIENFIKLLKEQDEVIKLD
jgi:hypothetical protein